MKTGTIILAVVTLLVLILLGGCATGKYVPKPNEELYGTWTNEKTQNKDLIQKAVYDAGGWEEYTKVSDARAIDGGTWAINSKWTDAQGNIWYEVFCSPTTGWAAGIDYEALYKLSRSSTILECVYKQTSQSQGISYPSKIDPTSDTYHIFYRAGT